MKHASSAPAADIAELGPAGNVYDKYHSKNPVERFLVANFTRNLLKLMIGLNPRTILEVGCGEGYVSGKIKAAFPESRLFACDLSKEIVMEARASFPAVMFFTASAYELPFASGSVDVVVVSEVLEHLARPGMALAEISRVTRGHVLVSVPREPVWRVLNMARGKYLRDWGNTPGHCQHWSKGTFLRLLGEYFHIHDVVTPLPWTICLCGKKDTIRR